MLCELCMPEAFCGLETVRKKDLSNLWDLWEKKLPSVLFVCCIIQWEHSISHRKTQMNRTHKGPQRHEVNRYHRTLQPSLAVTLCELCMPKAFCGLETVRKNAQWTLCALWEKKLPCVSQKCSFSHREHRWTEHTKVHRDIKSTDYTEPYSHRSLTPLPHSFQEHALLHLRTCPSTSKNTPFLMLENALLQRSLQHLDFM